MTMNMKLIPVVLILLLVSTFFSHPCFAQQPAEIKAEIAEMLTNPELHDESAVREAGMRHMYLLPVLSLLPETEENQILIHSSAFFLKFLLGDPLTTDYVQVEDKLYIRMPKYDSEIRNVIVDLMKDVYKRVSGKWQTLGLQEPRGFVYVWFLSRLDEMKEEFGTGETMMAFALPCRYVVIPYAVISERLYKDLQQRALLEGTDPLSVERAVRRFLDENFGETFAHELTHVFVNTTVGFRGRSGLDKWFQEGIAIWMAKGADHNLTEEYKDYQRLLDFIRMKYGNRRFLKFVHQTIALKSVEQGLQMTLNLSNPRQLRQESEKRYSEIQRAELLLLGLAILLLIVMAVRMQIYPYAFVIVSVVALYYWYYGLLNLWTDVPSASFVLNGIAVTLILAGPLLIARHLYQDRVRKASKTAVDSNGTRVSRTS